MFSDINFALIECTSLVGRGILYLVEVANDATEHMRKDFAAVWGGAHFITVSYLRGSIRLVGDPFLGCA
jgi:hypothetical protein